MIGQLPHPVPVRTPRPSSRKARKRLSGTSRGAVIGSLGLAVASLLALQACAVTPSSQSDGFGDDEAVAKLAGHLTGEYTNHAQVWGARQAGESVPDAYQVTIVPLTAHDREERLLHYRQYRVGESSSPYREARLLLEPGPDGGVTQRVQRRVSDAWQPLAGCTVHWRRTGDGFEGETRNDACRFRDPRTGEVVTRHRRWLVGAEGFTWTERRVTGQASETETLRFVPVSWYTGWAGVRARAGNEEGEGEWQVERGLRLHDGGAVRQLPDAGGKAHGIRLERLQWPNSGIRMLRLSVIEMASGEAIAYAWAPPGAAYIGIHLGWLQAGLETADTGSAGESRRSPETP